MSTSENLTVTHHKTLLSTSNPFEQKFGYHRAVRRGPFIAVSGTTALKLLPQSTSSVPTSEAPSPDRDITGFGSESKSHFPGDAYSQSKYVLKTCLAAVVRLGGRKEDVVRVRMFVADSKDCAVVGNAFQEIFGLRNNTESDAGGKEDLVGTTATMIVVPGGFVDGDILVEIEIDAFVV